MEERDSSDSEECSFFSIELRKPNSQWQLKQTYLHALTANTQTVTMGIRLSH